MSTKDASQTPHVPAAPDVSDVTLHAPPPAPQIADTDTGASADGGAQPVQPSVGLALRAALAQGPSVTLPMLPEGAGIHAPAGQALAETGAGDSALSAALLTALLGSNLTEGLQVPTADAQARVKPAFERWLYKARALGAGDAATHEAVASDADAAQAHASQAAHGRRYPLAWSMLRDVPHAASEGGEPSEAQAAHTCAAEDAAVAAEWTADAPDGQGAAPSFEKAPALPARPPRGAASIRPAAQRKKQPADAVPQDLLQQTSESALMWTEPSGGTSFRIDFSDDLFDETACIITVTGRDVVATFYVEDVNARRLLEAESRRLEANLAGRGISRAQVRIVTGAPPMPFASVEP